MTLKKEKRIKEENVINVPYCVRYIDGKEKYGYIKRKEMNNILAEYARKAKTEMNQEKTDHVLYGIKEYDKSGAVKILRLFVGYGMNDCAFYGMAKKQNGLVYAIHFRR